MEKSLSLDNLFVFVLIFAAFAIPPRYQHRVLMLGIFGTLVLRAVFIVAGLALLETLHAAVYVFGAVLLYAAAKMARGGSHPRPQRNPALRAIRRVLPATGRLHGQRFLIRDRGRLLATPLLLALVVVETTDVIFALDSILAILAITTDTFVVFTSNVFALLGMRAFYFLLAGAAGRLRYLQPGMAVILAAAAAKMMLAELYQVPAWATPVFIAAVLAAVAVLPIRSDRRRRAERRPTGTAASTGPGSGRPSGDGGVSGPRANAARARASPGARRAACPRRAAPTTPGGRSPPGAARPAAAARSARSPPRRLPG
jgi:tellurite resistance protein TerC